MLGASDLYCCEWVAGRRDGRCQQYRVHNVIVNLTCVAVRFIKLCGTLPLVYLYFVFWVNYSCDILVWLSRLPPARTCWEIKFAYITNSDCQHIAGYRTYWRVTWSLKPCLFHVLYCVESDIFTYLLTTRPFWVTGWAMFWSWNWKSCAMHQELKAQSVMCLLIDQWTSWSMILAHTFYISSGIRHSKRCTSCLKLVSSSVGTPLLSRQLFVSTYFDNYF